MGVLPNIDGNISITQLLNHTSGIYNYTANPDHQFLVQIDTDHHRDPLVTIENYVLAPNFPAGTGWSYSNTNYILLGLIIESATGNALEVEIDRRISTPLALHNTFLELGDSDRHIWANTAELTRARYTSAWAAGGIASTAADIAKWGQILYGGGFLQQSSYDAKLTFLSAGSLEYGLGVIRYQFSDEHGFAHGHGGAISGFASQLLYFPQYGASIALTMNSLETAASIQFASTVEAILDVMEQHWPDDLTSCEASDDSSAPLSIGDAIDGQISSYSRISDTETSQSAYQTSDRVDLGVTISIAPEDVGQAGKIYVVAVYAGNLYHRRTDNTWEAFSGELTDLRPTRETAALSSSEELLLLEKLTGIAGEFQFYFAYSNFLGVLKYGSSPYVLNISE